METLPVNGLDIFVLIVVGISGLLAFGRGLVHEALSIAGWIGAYFGAIQGLPLVRPYVRDLIPIQWIADGVSAVGLFVVCLIILNLVAKGISSQIEQSNLNSLNRSLGLLFGLARGMFITCVLFIFYYAIAGRDNPPQWMANAKTMPYIDAGVDMIGHLAPKEVAAAEGAARGAASQANNANELQKTYRKLTQPDPAAGGQADPAAPNQGYTPSQRQGLDRLFESN